MKSVENAQKTEMEEGGEEFEERKIYQREWGNKRNVAVGLLSSV